MNMKLPAIALVGALTVSLGSAMAAETPAAPTAPEAPEAPAAAPFALEDALGIVNLFDSSTWYDGAGEVETGTVEAINPASPAFWMSFIDPKTHTKRHVQFTNPAQYAVFMNPGFYTQFMNPSNWMAWFDVRNYAVLADGSTYTYWLQPGAYMHGMDPKYLAQAMDIKNYMPFVNPVTYMQWMDPAAYNIGGVAEGTVNFFNPMSWAETFQTAGNATQ